MRKFLQKAIILPLMVVVALIVVILVVQFGPSVKFDEPGFPTKTVEVITAKQLPFRSRSVAYGNVEPSVLLKTRAEISGKISYIHPDLKKGASLARGTVVLRIEPTTFEFTRDQSRAGLSSSESSLAQLEVEEKTTRRSLDIARENLDIGQKELARFRILWEKGVVTRSAIDAEEQKVLQLRQQVEDLEGKLAAFSSRKAATLAQIRKSKTELAQSEDTLGRTEVSLPFDARIGEIFVEEGEYVAASTALYEALGTKAVEIDAQLPISRFAPLISGLGGGAVNLQNPADMQMIFSKMKLGANVRLVGNGQETEIWRGEVLRIGEAIDPVRDTISVTVAVNNPYESVIPGRRPPLLKGMYVAVDLYTQPRKALVLPRKALHQGRVYIASADNKLEIRPVKILHKQGQLVVIESGLQPGEKVIITDVIPVMDGLPLNPAPAPDGEAQLAKDALGGDDIAADISQADSPAALAEETGK